MSGVKFKTNVFFCLMKKENMREIRLVKTLFMRNKIELTM